MIIHYDNTQKPAEIAARIAELEAERVRLLKVLNASRAFAAQIDRRVDPGHGLGAEFFHNNPEYRAFRRAIARNV